MFLAPLFLIALPEPLLQSSASEAEIVPGSEFRSELTHRTPDKTGPLEQCVWLVVSAGGPVTLTLDSLDFDPALEVEIDGQGIVARDADTGPANDAWLVLDRPGTSRFRLHIRSEDGRGGEFVLSARAGRVPPPSGLERARQDSIRAEAKGERAVQRGDHSEAAKHFALASRAAFGFGDVRRARATAERELGEAEAAADPLLVLQAKIDLGSAEMRLGDLRRSLTILETTLDPARARLAGAIGAEAEQAAASLAFVLQMMADGRAALKGPREALPLLREAVDLAPRTGREEFEPRLLSKLGELLDRSGFADEACTAFERSLTLAERLPKRVDTRAEVLLGWGRHLLATGRAPEARLACARALALGPRLQVTVELLGTLANGCLEVGRYEESKSALDQLESLCTEHEIRDYAIPILSTRAQIARRLADYARARSLLEDALWLQERSGIPAHRAGVLVDLAGVLLLDGNGVEAAARYEQALEACQATGDRRQESLVRQSLGMLLEGRRDYAGALDEFDAAADLAEQGGERSLLAKARGGRGWILYRQGRFEEARKLLQPVADELEMLGEGEAASDAYDTLARVALGRGDLAGAESLLAAAERVLPLDAAGGIGRFESAGLRSRFVALGELAQDLAWRRVLAATDPASRDAAVRRGWQEAGAWKGRTVLEGLRTHGPAPASIDSLPGIERGSALIEYAAGEESLRAYVVGPEAIELLDLGPRQPIEIATRQLVTGLSERLLGFESFASEAFALHAKLLVPVLARLSGDTRTLVIVPTPDLAVLPFEALVTRDPGLPPVAERFRDLHYLIDEFAVVSAPSSPVFARLQSRPARTRTPRFLVLGDPVYLPESARSSPSIDLALARPADSILDLSRLRGTAEESHRIAALVLLGNTGSADADKARLVDLQGRRSGSLSTDRLDLRLGAEANPDVLRADLRGYTHIHIAAHGLVDSQDPRHSGLVFSWRPRDQGFTPLEDILDLRLDAELVVLSACDTARGRIVGGEGVQSLANAFLEAGARAVLASLWRLDDDDAAVLMKDFYERILRRGVPAVDAMRQAKLAFRRSGLDRGRRADGGDPEYPVDASAYHAHPHYWAPFLMVGAPPR